LGTVGPKDKGSEGIFFPRCLCNICNIVAHLRPRLSDIELIVQKIQSSICTL
jgi:hypothetical protein